MNFISSYASVTGRCRHLLRALNERRIDGCRRGGFYLHTGEEGVRGGWVGHRGNTRTFVPATRARFLFVAWRFMHRREVRIFIRCVQFDFSASSEVMIRGRPPVCNVQILYTPQLRNLAIIIHWLQLANHLIAATEVKENNFAHRARQGMEFCWLTICKVSA